MPKISDGVPADKLALYEKLVATLPEVERKGATVPYTSLNGHMFGYLGKTGTLALRLPEPARQSFLDKCKPKPTTRKPAATARTKPAARSTSKPTNKR